LDKCDEKVRSEYTRKRPRKELKKRWVNGSKEIRNAKLGRKSTKSRSVEKGVSGWQKFLKGVA